MIVAQTTSPARRLTLAALLIAGALGVYAAHSRVQAQSRSGFPEGFDAVEAAPRSHKVIFENEFIRVLQVVTPPAGTAEPMHHHRWPSLFLRYETGGKSAHLRYHTPDGKVLDIPSRNEPVHLGTWTAHWMAPEALHSVETVEDAQPGPGASPGWIRIEVKCALR
jgi:hypothetical protein